MAFYIDNKEVINLSRSTVGFGIICDYIGYREGFPVYVDFNEYEFPVYVDFNEYEHCVIIHTYCNGYEGNKSMLSNTVTIESGKICVNPCSDKNGQNYTLELYHYILDIVDKIQDRRNDKINQIIS